MDLLVLNEGFSKRANIHIGDIFRSDDHLSDCRREYYQVVALRGKTQVVLRAIYLETYINEGIAEDSPLFWRRKRTCPLPGRFITETGGRPVHSCGKGGQEILDDWQTVTAWVLPCLAYGVRTMLREISEISRRMGVFTYMLGLPEDWEPWDAEKIQELKEYDCQRHEKFMKGELDATCPEDPT